MNRIRYHFWIYVGLMVMVMGLALRTVEVFVLSAGSTRTLHGWFGGPAATPGTSLERLALQSDNVARREVRPPTWLGYALLSGGAVMVVNGVIKRKR
jgi:hypothetical protein